MEANIGFLTRYVPKNELAALIKNAHGKEGGFFQELLLETEKKIREVPPIYANEDIGLDAKVRLHYFGGATDFWISELDHETGDAFGYVCLNGDTDNAELSYCNIDEIVATNRLELDLYWNDKTTIREIMVH